MGGLSDPANAFDFAGFGFASLQVLNLPLVTRLALTFPYFFQVSFFLAARRAPQTINPDLWLGDACQSG